jgi:aminocarboxymuconate-semialdehyde decarboxylase
MSQSPLVIDVHAHVLPRDLPDMAARTGTSDWVTLRHHGEHPDVPFGCAHMYKGDRFFRAVDANLWDDDARLRDMDRFGVDVQVLSTVPVLFSYGADADAALALGCAVNDDIAARVARFPGRFAGLGTLPMQDPAMAARELERCKANGLCGVQIGSHVGRWELDDPAIDEVWAAAVQHDSAVFVHPWDMMGVAEGRLQRHWLPWLVSMPAETSAAMCSILMGGVLDRFPTLRLVFAHGGGAFPATLGRIDHGFAVRPDLCQTATKAPPSSYAGRFWLDSLVHDVDMLRLLVARFGADRVCLGTDYPFPLGELEPGRGIRDAAFSADVEASLLGGAACAAFGLDPASFGRAPPRDAR